MFDTLGFLWIHHGNPQYVIYLLDKLVAWLDGWMGRGKIPPKSVQLSPPYNVCQLLWRSQPSNSNIPPCESGEMSVKIKSMVECHLKQVAKASVAEVDGYDTVH